MRKPFNDGTVVTHFQEADACGTGCSYLLDGTVSTTFDGVYFRGVEAHWAPSFVTIADRVQVGLNIAGGIAVAEGVVRETGQFAYTWTVNGQTTTETQSYDESTPAKEMFFAKIPLFKLEAQAGVILAPGLKVKLSGGINNPGLGMRVTAIYLIGAN